MDWDKVWTWAAPILKPVVLLVIATAVVLRLQLWTLIKDWSDRSVIALSLIFTFCLMSIADPTAIKDSGLKEVVLIVVGFYFGVAHGRRETSSSGDADSADVNKTRR